MATQFTATSSTLLIDTFRSRSAVTVQNDGAGTLLILVHDNPNTAATVSSTNKTVSIPSGGYWESPPGTFGVYYGIFLSAGTAYWTDINNRLN